MPIFVDWRKNRRKWWRNPLSASIDPDLDIDLDIGRGLDVTKDSEVLDHFWIKRDVLAHICHRGWKERQMWQLLIKNFLKVLVANFLLSKYQRQNAKKKKRSLWYDNQHFIMFRREGFLTFFKRMESHF